MVNVTCVVPQLQIKFFFKRKKVTSGPSLLCSLSVAEIKALCPAVSTARWQHPKPPLFPSKVGFLPVALRSETQKGAGENLFISSTGSASLTRIILAKGCFPVTLHFGLCFCCFVKGGTGTCSRHTRTMLLRVVFLAVVTDEP